MTLEIFELVHVYVQARGQPQVPPSETLSTSLEAGSLIGLELIRGEAGGPPGARDVPVLTSPALGLQVCNSMPSTFAWVLGTELRSSHFTIKYIFFSFSHFPYNIKTLYFPSFTFLNTIQNRTYWGWGVWLTRRLPWVWSSIPPTKGLLMTINSVSSFSLII